MQKIQDQDHVAGGDGQPVRGDEGRTEAVDTATKDWLDKAVDWDMAGKPITHRMCIETQCGSLAVSYIEALSAHLSTALAGAAKVSEPAPPPSIVEPITAQEVTDALVAHHLNPYSPARSDMRRALEQFIDGREYAERLAGYRRSFGADALWVERLRETAVHLRENSLSLAKYPGMGEEARARELAALYIGEIAELHAQMPAVQPAEEGKDSQRFAWYFSDKPKGEFLMTYLAGMSTGWTTDQWRAAIDEAMKFDGLSR